MFPEGAALFEQALLPLLDWRGKKVLNVGSSSWSCYAAAQPYIYEKVLKPLLDRGALIINLDLQAETFELPEGMTHVVGDASAHIPFDAAEIDVVLCTSMIEHTLVPHKMLDEIARVLKPEGLMWFEAPANYPLHNDPIDTGLRLYSRAAVEEFLGDGWKVERYWEFVSMSCPSVAEHGSGVLGLVVRRG